ncbi:MAG: sugar phosphate isomerase/epimerase family protein, partial [Planctomycetota bacterium]|nr:sugar phosphate isomerase/epimerase family protein [Planctomycetota bacterium]
MIDRRTFLASSALATSPAWAEGLRRVAPTTRFGLVTYLWGRDLSLPVLLKACADTGLDGVELRTTHAHGVEPGIGEAEASAVRTQAEDAGVAIVGLGSNERFDSPDSRRVAAAIEATRGFIRASAAVGGGGVKVKPDSFHPGVEPGATIEQIALSLATLGPFAADHGQEIRLEVHGGCADPAVIAEIVARADHPAVRVCWNCNPQDLRGPGFRHHYDLLRPRFGGTLHVRELDAGDYPVQELVQLLDRDGYDGFVLLEAHSPPPPARTEALGLQRRYFERLVSIGRRPSAAPGAIRIEPRGGSPGAPEVAGYDVRVGDEPFATLRFGEGERTPSIFPLFAPGRLGVLRTFPFARIAGESDD